jgi:hypothetical protein
VLPCAVLQQTQSTNHQKSEAAICRKADGCFAFGYANLLEMIVE